MKELSNSFRNRFNNLKNSIEPVIGLITLLIGFLTIITKFLESKYSIAIIFTGGFLLIRMISNEVIKAKKESFGIVVNKYPPGKIRLAKFLNYSNYILLLFPVYTIFNPFFNISTNCLDDTRKFGVIIANFSRSEEDDFSYKLFNCLETELQNLDTIKLFKAERFIAASEPNYLDSIKQSFEAGCLNNGILVFGKRSTTSKLFDCKIYIKGLFHSDKDKKKKIIYVENPDMIHFSIDYQANTISDFVMGLLYYRSGNNELSKSKFNRCLNLNVKNNRQFKSYCHLFLGNINYIEKNYETAHQHYLKGLSEDPSNAFLHYNLGTKLLNDGNTQSAYEEYQTAHAFNQNIINPLSKDDIASNKIDNHPKGNLLLLGMKQKLMKDSIKITPNILSDETEAPKNGYTRLKFHDGLYYGVLNSRGDTIIGCCRYHYILIVTKKEKTFFIVNSINKFGALDTNADEIIPIVHPNMEYVQYLIDKVI
ncbi:Tetratricopeptide repeat protein [compost metagenome]